MKAFYIFRREFKGYLVSPISYAIGAVFLGISGYLFSLHLILGQRVDFFPQLCAAMVFILMFMVPALSMRLLAEERSQRTIALLLTSPVRAWEIIVGKYLACLGFVCCMLAVTTIYPWVLTRYGSPDLGVVTSSYLGGVLLISCFVAIGVFTSSLSDSQMMAAVLSFGISLLFWMIQFMGDPVGEALGPNAGDFVRAFSLNLPLQEFLKGAVHGRYVVFYLSFTAFFLYLATRKVASDSWR